MRRSLPSAMVLAMTVAAATIPACASPEQESDEAIAETALAQGITPSARSPKPIAPPVSRQSIESVPILTGVPADPALTSGGSAPMTDTARQRRIPWSIEPDEASYALVRWHLDRRSLPPPELFSVSGLANAFDDLHPEPPPYSLGLAAEVFPSPTRPGFHILSLVVRGTNRSGDVLDDVLGAHYVVVVEAGEAAIPRIREALRTLVDTLGGNDRLGLVAHGPRGRMILESTRGTAVQEIYRAIDTLREGKPDLVAGLQLGYGMAAVAPGRPVRILLFADGTGIDPVTDSLLDDLRRQARAGFTLSIAGFPTEGYDHRLMARLARAGDGRHAVVDNPSAARRLFSWLPDRLTVVAQDASGRIELSPETVSRFRVLGAPRASSGTVSERGRTLTAGSQATALIELQLNGRSGPLGVVRVRYRSGSGAVKHLEVALEPPRAAASNRTPPRGLRPWIAATFGEKLGGSYWARDVSYGRLLRSFRTLDDSVRTEPATAELRYLIQQARRLEPRQAPSSGLPADLRASTTFDRLRVLE